MTAPRTAGSLAALARPLRRMIAVRWVLAFLSGAVAVQALAVWALRAGLGAPAYLVLAAWITMVALLVVAGWRVRVELRGFRPAALAHRLERLGVARRGAVTALLDSRAQGTSGTLVGAADLVRAEEVARGGGPALAPARRRLRRASLLLVLVLAGGLASLAGARPRSGAAALLWKPGWALTALLTPVRLSAHPATVERGEPVTLRYQATGQRSAVLWRRAPGEPWSSAPVSLDSAGRGSLGIDRVDSDLYFHLTSGTRASDTVRVAVRVPAFLGSLKVTARYPGYLGLDDETLNLLSGAVLLPAGTELVTEGVVSVPVREAAWTGPTTQIPLPTDDRSFGGRFRLRESGVYELSVTTGDGRALAGDPVRMALTLVRDSVPEVVVLAPGSDTTVPPDRRLAVVADARDDHGLIGARLLVRRGGSDSRSRILTAPVEGIAERLLLHFPVDLTDWSLVPGDTVRYMVEVTDNAPEPQTGRSPEYLLVVPTLADERAAQRALAAGAQATMDSLIAAGRRLERETSDLSHQRARAETGSRQGDRQLGFDEAQRADAAARGQEELAHRAEELEQTLEQLRDAVERGMPADTALARRLAEVSEQLARALSPELRRRLDELQRSIQALDPHRTREALQALAEAQREMWEALERSRDLFERAALEAELSTLAEDAREVAQAQAELNRQFAQGDTTTLAAEEQQLAQRTDSIAAGLDRAATRLDPAPSRDQLQQTAERAREAGGQMRDAAAAAQRGDRQHGRRQGEGAQASMEEVARHTDDQRERQQDAWREAVMRALDRAMAETARLSRQQLEVAEGLRRGGSAAAARGRQTMVEESAQKLAEQIRAVSGQNALVSPRIATALALARRHMASARDAVSSGTPSLGEARDHAGAAVDALNAAAFAMARARQEVGGSSSGSGLAEAMEQMTRMAEQQGQVSNQTNGLLPMAGQASIQPELQRLAAEQRRLAEGMERMRAQGEIPGARDLAREAQDLARRLESGRLDRETVARQERLFRRMLDAGRTLQADESDERKERQAVAAVAEEIRLPAAVQRRSGADRLRVPTWEELRSLSPEERRLATEYFRRLVERTEP